MTLAIRQNIMSASFQSVKAPNSMVPIGLTFHNTANDATADAEIRNINNNNPNSTVSFHLAVDDIEVVQAIPFNRNAWHAGDGANGTGNRRTIAIEICFSKSGGIRFTNAEQNAAKLGAQLLKENGWTIKDCYQHADWSNKNCPHRTRELGWQRFLNMVQAELNALNGTTSNNNNNQQTHIVKGGETLTSIARQYNMTVDTLAKANNITNVNLIRTGQVLTIPNSNGTTTQQFFPATQAGGTSLVDALNAINVDSSFANREKIARANGISGYSGTTDQNMQLLNLLRQGKLIRP